MKANVTTPGPVAGPVVDLDFGVEGAATVEYAAVPTLGFDLRVTCRSGHSVHSIVLDVQVQIAARRRSYGEHEQARLVELFGEPGRWSTTLRTLPWLRTTQVVPAFVEETRVELRVPCSYDFEVTAAKYMHALGDGEVPLELLFGGTAFYASESGMLQAAMIGWDREADFRLPVAVWRQTMDHYFPGSAWLRLERGAFDRLYAYRARHALASWEQTLDALLAGEEGNR